MGYIQIKSPDGNALRELIGKVKGDRSMAKFADDIKLESPNTKVSAPTLSRAMNWVDGNSPVSVDLITAIAKVAGDTGVTLEQLIEANGMRSQETDSDLEKQSFRFRRRIIDNNTERNVKMMLQNEIAIRNYHFQQLSEFANWKHLYGYRMQKDRVFPRNYTFGFSVSGMSPCSIWKFALNPQMLVNADQFDAEGYVGNFINKVGSVFASDSFESELYENEKYSFVFIDRVLYNLFLDRINKHGLLVNGFMTAILVDLDKGRVVEETQFKRYDGAEAVSFFKEPVTQTMGEYELSDPFYLLEE